MYNRKNIFKIIAIIIVVVLVIVFGGYNRKIKPEPKIEMVKKIKQETVKEYPFRKYLHVKNFYKSLLPESIDICLKYNIPPAAVWAIAGLQSGYGRWYVSKITGNILGLSAGKGDASLPSLYIPNILNFPDRVLYTEKDIKKYDKSELSWKKRPPSFKKDYRPKNIAGTTKNLDFFENNPKKRIKANLACIEDFAKNWISLNSKLKTFADARKFLDNEVKLYSKEILFDRNLNIKFINMIGGKKNSFSYRKTWPRKVNLIMDRVGLVKLTKSLHVKDKNFDELW